MCGIVGYAGNRDAVGVLLDGLRRLEYRGYDSAGLAVQVEDRPRDPAGHGEDRAALRPGRARAREGLDRAGPHPLGHPRAPVRRQCASPRGLHRAPGRRAQRHPRELPRAPQPSSRRTGIASAPRPTRRSWPTWSSATTWTAPTWRRPCRAALRSVRGAYAFCMLAAHEPGRLVAAKLGGGSVVVGQGDGEMFIASDIPAVLPYTRSVTILEDGEVAVVTSDRLSLSTLDGRPVERRPSVITWDAAMAEKGGYPHFMLKEIHEQPRGGGQHVPRPRASGAGRGGAARGQPGPGADDQAERAWSSSPAEPRTTPR